MTICMRTRISTELRLTKGSRNLIRMRMGRLRLREKEWQNREKKRRSIIFRPARWSSQVFAKLQALIQAGPTRSLIGKTLLTWESLRIQINRLLWVESCLKHRCSDLNVTSPKITSSLWGIIAQLLVKGSHLMATVSLKIEHCKSTTVICHRTLKIIMRLGHTSLTARVRCYVVSYTKMIWSKVTLSRSSNGYRILLPTQKSLALKTQTQRGAPCRISWQMTTGRLTRLVGSELLR